MFNTTLFLYSWIQEGHLLEHTDSVLGIAVNHAIENDMNGYMINFVFCKKNYLSHTIVRNIYSILLYLIFVYVDVL